MKLKINHMPLYNAITSNMSSYGSKLLYMLCILSFNFQHLNLLVLLFGFNIKISTHVMKPWKLLHVKMLCAIECAWNQKFFLKIRV